MNTKMDSKIDVNKILNPKAKYHSIGDEDIRIIGGKTNGLMNFNTIKHREFVGIYKKMRARTWFPEQVNIAKDKVNFSLLKPEEQRTYELLLSQLIASDSIQANTLADDINQYITSPVVNACIIEQASQECVHANSYAIMAEEIVPSVTKERIYVNHINNICLDSINKVFSQEYRIHNEPTIDSILHNIITSQALEGILFPCSFAFFLGIEDKMTGTSEMIKEIYKDEILSHVPLFGMIYNTIMEEYNLDRNKYRNIFERKLFDLSLSIKEWLEYATDGSIRIEDIEQLINYRTKSTVSWLFDNKDLSDDEVPINKYITLLKLALKGGEFMSKTNFFEANATEYSRGTIKQDY